MLTRQRRQSIRPAFQAAAQASLPGWVQRILVSGTKRETDQPSRKGPGEGLCIKIVDINDLMLIEVCVPKASTMAPLSFQQRTAQAYHAIRRMLNENQIRHAIRIWNYIPQIQAVMPDGLDRYMVFNAGRYAAYYDWFNNKETLGGHIPTATGIGHSGSDLFVQVLAAKLPGLPVENPRQVQAHRYSQRYGPMPPCFARATVTPLQNTRLPDLLIGGTASVHGERSTHDNNITAQTKETLINLAHLTEAAVQSVHGEDATNPSTHIEASLRTFQSMRIYYRNECDLDTIKNIVWPFVDHLDPSMIELVHADICRHELLVEIEGTASLDR